MVPVKRGGLSVMPVGIECSSWGVSERVWV